MSAKRLLKINKLHGAQNYAPLPVILRKGYGVYLEDIKGRRYYDFLSSYSSVNQGHCHPRLVNVMQKQCEELTLCSRAFHNENLIHFYEFMNNTFLYDKCLPMNTGVEGGETAVKLARLWGYKVKGVPENKAQVLMARNNFWGRTIAACSSSSDPTCFEHFGPYTPGFDLVKFNDIEHLEHKFRNNANIVAYMFEPIQGEAGIIIPNADYLCSVRELCNKYNVLMICDEVQTGIGRTGEMLASSSAGSVRPDMIILGKALSGGMLPVSAVLGNNEVMDLMSPGMHGSTFGGNPLASKIAIEAVSIIFEENLMKNARIMGKTFRTRLEEFIDDIMVKDVRGVGLLNAIEFHCDKDASTFVNICLQKGLLCKTTRDNVVRMCPPLTISSFQMEDSIRIIENILIDMLIHKS